MASFNVASDLQTKELVWVAKNSKDKQIVIAGEILTSSSANISRVYAERYKND
jgi:hypothetical protein